VKRVIEVQDFYELGALIAAIIGGIVTYFFPSIRGKISGEVVGDKDLPKSFNWDIHSNVHELLTELRINTDSARAQIVQFHNTGEFVDGISMKKLTCTHESVNSGVSGQGGLLKDQMITMFLPLINKVKDNDPKIYSKEKNMPNFKSTDITNEVFQRKGRIGKIWRKRFALENSGNFLNTLKGWVWDDGKTVTLDRPKKTRTRKAK
jgi:hypothetical protein